jgi:glycosyltransferase involved in cell wall biosynthesis
MISERLRRVLFVSYLFPPVGGVGVQRVTKFVKYLPEFGWQSSVLTVENPSVPLFDDSYERDIPANTIIRRARTWEPDYALKRAVAAGTNKGGRRGLWHWAKGCIRRAANLVLQPDSQVLWHRAARKAGLQLLKEVPHDVIVATGPPFSSLLLGAQLAARTGLPLILDYRDEWSISNAYWENKQQGWLENWIQRRQQYSAVRAAQVLLATTPSSAKAIAAIGAEAGSHARSACIYNGFDPADFAQVCSRTDAPALVLPPELPPRSPDEFRLAFVGTLWNLNSIEPLVNAIEQLSVRYPALAARLELVLVGRRTADQEQLLDRLKTFPCTVHRLQFVEHAQAVQIMRDADALLMLNSAVAHAERVINAKTFEYMAARRPMFVIAPEGDVWDITRDLPGTVLCRPQDLERITEGLALAIEQHRCGVIHDPADWQIERFERRELAKQLAQLLDETALAARTRLLISGNKRSGYDSPEWNVPEDQIPGEM